MLITISQTTISPTQNYLGTVPVLRGFYSKRFIAGDGVTPVEPGNGLTGFFYSIACSVNGSGQIVIPAFTIQSTTDGNLPTSRFTGQLFDQSGAPREIIFGNQNSGNGWQIPTVYGANVDLADLFRYNASAVLLNPIPTYFTADQTIAEILALAGQFDYARVNHLGLVQMRDAPDVASIPIVIGANSFATTSLAGIGRASVAPANPLIPIFIGQNDPLITSVIDDPGVAGVYSIQSAANSHWFENQGGRVNRVGGRFLVGDAALSDGNTPNTRKDWVETMGGSGAYRLPFSGTVNTSGTAVTWVSGDVFPDYPPGALVGQVIIIATVHYTILSVTDSTHLVLTSSAGVQAGAAYAVGQGVLQGTNSAQAVSLTTENISSNIALFAGAQTRYNTQAVEAGVDIVVNNNLTVAVPAWGRYIEAHSWNRIVSVNNETTGLEIEIINRSGLSSPVAITPYTSGTTILTSALQIGVGGGLDAVGQFNASAGLIFFANPMKAAVGIVMDSAFLAPSGPGGSYVAMALARDYQIQWYRTDGQICGTIYGGGDTDEVHIVANGGLMVGTEGGSSFSGPNALVDSVQATRGLNLVTTDTQAMNKGAQLGLGGRNGSGGVLETFSFGTIAGRKEDNTANHYNGYLQFSTCTQAAQLLEAMRISSKQSVVIGTAALLTTATDGFPYIPSCPGTPTGVPTAFTGRVPMVYDSSANKIWFYNGSWRGVAVT